MPESVPVPDEARLKIRIQEWWTAKASGNLDTIPTFVWTMAREKIEQGEGPVWEHFLRVNSRLSGLYDYEYTFTRDPDWTPPNDILITRIMGFISASPDGNPCIYYSEEQNFILCVVRVHVKNTTSGKGRFGETFWIFEDGEWYCMPKPYW